MLVSVWYKSVREKSKYIMYFREKLISYDILGRVAQSVTCLATDVSLTANPGIEFDPGLVSYFRGD